MTSSRYRLLLLSALIIGCADGHLTAESSSAPGLCNDDQQTLIATLFGAVSGPMMAYSEPATCAGRERPTGNGIRLHFQTREDGASARRTIILGIDALEAGKTADALRTTVTLVDESARRFFSTGEQENCFSDVQQHVSLREGRTRLSGLTWCTRAIPGINGNRESVRVRDLEFSAVVEWR